MSWPNHKEVPARNYVAVVLALVSMLNCKSTPPTTATPPSEWQQNRLMSTKSSVGPDIDLNCVMSHIQSPPESFHYAFKVDSDNPWEEDADVTPQQIDGTFLNSSLPKPQPFHGAPREVSSNLMAIGRMASLFATVRNTAAVVNEGAEEGVNGYSTVKYSIDTTRGTATDQALYKSVFGAGGFEKGNVWVTSQGCPVRIILNEELHSKDGGVTGKNHYEEAIIKK